jgi:hypothetical protein
MKIINFLLTILVMIVSIFIFFTVTESMTTSKGQIPIGISTLILFLLTFLMFPLVAFSWIEKIISKHNAELTKRAKVEAIGDFMEFLEKDEVIKGDILVKSVPIREHNGKIIGESTAYSVLASARRKWEDSL